MAGKAKATPGAAASAPKAAPAPSTEADRGTGRELRGVVKSNKMAKTITVEVVRTVRHPKYNKFIKKHARYYAHDERQEAAVGDVVDIVETRPMSKLKRWRLRSIAEKASV